MGSGGCGGRPGRNEHGGVIKEKRKKEKEGKKASANERSVALRAEKEKISVFKSDAVDVKERAVSNRVNHIGLDYL